MFAKLCHLTIDSADLSQGEAFIKNILSKMTGLRTLSLKKCVLKNIGLTEIVQVLSSDACRIKELVLDLD